MAQPAAVLKPAGTQKPESSNRGKSSVARGVPRASLKRKVAKVQMATRWHQEECARLGLDVELEGSFVRTLKFH